MQKVALVLSCLACGAHARGAAKKGKPLEVLASLLRANSYYPAAPSPRGFGDADASAYDAYWAREAGAIQQDRTGTDVRGIASGRIQNVRGVAGGRMSSGPEESTGGRQHGGDVFDWEAEGGAVPRNRVESYPPLQPGNRNVGFEWATETGAIPHSWDESRMARQPGGDVFDRAHHVGQIPRGGADENEDESRMARQPGGDIFDRAHHVGQIPRGGADEHDPWMIAKKARPHGQDGLDWMEDWAQRRQSAGPPRHNRVPQTSMADMRGSNEQGNVVKTAVSGILLAAAAYVLYMQDPKQNLLAEWGDKLTNLVEYMQDPKQNLLAEWGNKLTNLVDTFTP